MRDTLHPNHKVIKAYYADVAKYEEHAATKEASIRDAFQTLLKAIGKEQGWILIPEKSLKGKDNKRIQVDAALQNDFQIERGYWEAKDTDDKLEVEIKKKIDAGYPLTNMIFEDTKTAILYQDNQRQQSVNLRTDKEGFVILLQRFFSYAPPAIQEFERAVEQFKTRIPNIAQGLADKIKLARQEDKQFQAAFQQFFQLCQDALNPNLRQEAVDEMLVQHLMTERLFRKIFNNADFMSRNIIAQEIEKVIANLTHAYFNRDEFVGSLNHFYEAIEAAARTQQEYSQKQDFLNTVYERFFQSYSVKQADTHGIVYTPQPIVDFMCASVEEVLQSEFGLKLGDPTVNILDPATGTGNFIVNLLRRIPINRLEHAYKNQLFANEVMLLPYYIASLNIEREYYERMGKYAPFEGISYVDTLDMAARQKSLGLFDEENAQRVQRQQAAPITVIIGNPPYNVGQLNENDNNKNRVYPIIDGRIRETYAKGSAATLNTKLYDAYVKFFRWAVDRLQGRDGIVCYVSNNSFVDQLAFDAMRRELFQDFSLIYHLDLHGNVRQNAKISGTSHNVFGIQVGVGITLAIRSAKHGEHRLFYHRVPEMWRKEQKLVFLEEKPTLQKVEWSEITPDNRHTWIIPDNADEFSVLIPLCTKQVKSQKGLNAEAIFKTFSLGVSTNRDKVVYDFDIENLTTRIEQFSDDYNSELNRYQFRSPQNIDDFLDYTKIKWSRNLKRHLQNRDILKFSGGNVRYALYRPFTKTNLYFADIALDEMGQIPKYFPNQQSESENQVICVSDIGYRANSTSALVTNLIPDLHLCASTDGHQCFPFYVYDEGGSNRRENITDWALDQFRTHYQDTTITKWDIFHYVYGLLHHPTYRERYADNLKRDLPRIPFAPDFRAFAVAGQQLAELHLGYETVAPYPLDYEWVKGTALTYRVEKMRLSKDKTALVFNNALTMRGIPPETFEYRLGNRSALEWVIDQYQVSEDKRSGITSDPNDADNPQYIFELVGKVIAVSVQTAEIVRGLPELFASGD